MLINIYFPENPISSLWLRPLLHFYTLALNFTRKCVEKLLFSLEVPRLYGDPGRGCFVLQTGGQVRLLARWLARACLSDCPRFTPPSHSCCLESVDLKNRKIPHFVLRYLTDHWSAGLQKLLIEIFDRVENLIFFIEISQFPFKK